MTTSIGFDIYAKDTASAKFDALGNKIDGTSTKFAKIGQVAKVAGLAIVAGVGVAAVALVGMTKAAIEDEAAQQKLALGLKNATGATTAQVAAAEKWITAQGNALGVTDDELRPALQKLAQSTGDVGKAQKQLQIAMDISAGSGKSLAAVTEAIMKANNGSITGLSRLGVATKNAAGETLGLDAIMGKAAETFGGQAAAKADTLSGKMDILKLRFNEAKESVGAKLIPVLMQLSDWVITTGVPAIERFVQGWKNGTGAGGTFAAIVGTVGSALMATAGFVKENATALSILTGALGTAYVGFKTIMFVKNVSAAIAAFNVVLLANPIGLVVVALAALGVALFIAWKKSETFREVVTGAWNAVRNATTYAFDAVRDKVSGVINFIGGIFRAFSGPEIIAGKFAAIRENVSEAGAAIRERISAAWSAVRERTAEAWSAVSTVVGEKIGNVMEKVGSLKDRVLGALAGAGTWLYSAGAELIQGLINGITSKLAALTAKMAELANKIKGFLPGSPVKEGPLKSWNNGGAGKRLVSLLADGMSDTAPVDAAMNNLASRAHIVGSGSFSAGATGGAGATALGAGSAGGGDSFVFNIVSNDPDAVVAAIQQYVKRNGRLRNVAMA